MTSVELLRHRRDTTSTDVAATALFRASETISKGLSRVPFHTPDVQIRPIPGSLGPWVPGSLKSNFKWCRASAKHLCQKSSNDKSEVLQGGCAIMGTSPCSDSIVPIKMSASMAVTGPWKADSKELALQHECAHCCSAAGKKPRHGKMLPENTLKKPCWLPVGWWFKLSTYLSNVSGFDWSS